MINGVLRIIALIIPFFCFPQFCETLGAITDTNTSYEVKKAKIDSLFKKISERSNMVEIAEFHHCVGLKLYYDAFSHCKNSRKDTDSCDDLLENAIVSTEKALEIKMSINAPDLYSLKRTLYNLGFLNFKKGSTYSAVGYYEKLVRLGNPDKKTRDANLKLAGLYESMGDFHKAIEKYEESVVLFSKENSLNEENVSFLIEKYLQKANLYSLMGFEEYSSHIKTNINKADSLIVLYDTGHNKYEFEQIRINQIEGNRLVEIGEYKEALPYHQSVVSSLSMDNFQDLAIAQNSLGFTQFKLKTFNQARINLQKAIISDPLYADPYNNLGDLNFELKEFKKGMRNYQKAIVYSINPSGKIEYEENPTLEELDLAPNKLSLLNHIVTKANAWVSYFEFDSDEELLTNALDTFMLADILVDIIRSESTEYQSKLYWRAQSSSLYMNAIKVCHLLNKPEDAFYFMERNKALLLLEDLTNEAAKEIFQIPIKEAQHEFDLKRAIFLSESKLQENIRHLGVDSLANFKETIRNHKYNYKKFVDSLNETYPDYAKFKRKVDVLSFNVLKANYITENKATLHYILNEEDGYGLLTTADTTELFQLHYIPNLNKEIENLITALSNGVSDMGNFKVISNTVFKNLVPKNVYDKIKGKQLTIIPDYILQQIPFESLVVDINKLTYLFQEVEIGYAYSASLLEYNQQQKDSRKDFLAVAPITFDNLKLPELYFSEKEVNSIAGVFSGETLLNGQASKDNFIKNANKHNILHLATHADIGDGENPWIAFSDSKMYLKEIYATKNQVDMVVLSACNTSTGELRRGEGVMSLARGFFYSGAKSVVSTLWPVADEAGKDILINFYKNLNNGLTKSKALQKAKLEYLNTTEEEELKHPYYWAGFVVLGDNSPVSDKPTSPWLLLGLGLLGTVILTFGYKKIKAHRAAA